MKTTKRSERRHHTERLKKNRRYYWGWYREDEEMPETIKGKVVQYPKKCSCWMGCGNARKHHKEITIQEHKNELTFKEECDKIGYTITKNLKKKYKDYY
jgi:hypothetical protein